MESYKKLNFTSVMKVDIDLIEKLINQSDEVIINNQKKIITNKEEYIKSIKKPEKIYFLKNNLPILVKDNTYYYCYDESSLIQFNIKELKNEISYKNDFFEFINYIYKIIDESDYMIFKDYKIPKYMDAFKKKPYNTVEIINKEIICTKTIFDITENKQIIKDNIQICLFKDGNAIEKSFNHKNIINNEFIDPDYYELDRILFIKNNYVIYELDPNISLIYDYNY